MKGPFPAAGKVYALLRRGWGYRDRLFYFATCHFKKMIAIQNAVVASLANNRSTLI